MRSELQHILITAFLGLLTRGGAVQRKGKAVHDAAHSSSSPPPAVLDDIEQSPSHTTRPRVRPKWRAWRLAHVPVDTTWPVLQSPYLMSGINPQRHCSTQAGLIFRPYGTFCPSNKSVRHFYISCRVFGFVPGLDNVEDLQYDRKQIFGLCPEGYHCEAHQKRRQGRWVASSSEPTPMIDCVRRRRAKNARIVNSLSSRLQLVVPAESSALPSISVGVTVESDATSDILQPSHVAVPSPSLASAEGPLYSEAPPIEAQVELNDVFWNRLRELEAELMEQMPAVASNEPGKHLPRSSTPTQSQSHASAWQWLRDLEDEFVRQHLQPRTTIVDARHDPLPVSTAVVEPTPARADPLEASWDRSDDLMGEFTQQQQQQQQTRARIDGPDWSRGSGLA